ncbi:MAG: response regulator [Phycisphaeraceae bacterium]|nr:response regulator [Phycisphaeraceae bacterium]
MNAPTVLVVDDESHVTNVVSLKLRQAGLNVLIANDGEEAYETACEQVPDLIVTDFQMPYMSGLELAYRLRENPRLAAVPVLMVTARGHLVSEDERARTNIKSIMCKPFAPREMLDRVMAILGLRENEAAAA